MNSSNRRSTPGAGALLRSGNVILKPIVATSLARIMHIHGHLRHANQHKAMGAQDFRLTHQSGRPKQTVATRRVTGTPATAESPDTPLRHRLTAHRPSK